MKSFYPVWALASFVSTLPKAQSSPIRYFGRVNPATLELSWPSTGVGFTFTGTTATINVASVSGLNSVDLFIDGNAPLDIPEVVTSITIPTLVNGTHTVLLRKRSEAVFGSIFLGNVTTDGTFVTYTPPSRQIEIIGDSITVGYGLDGLNPCENTAAVEDNPKTYAALAANALDADYSVVAWSGKGLTRNIVTPSGNDTSPLIPELYTRYGANDADGSYTFPLTWSPQAVVITLGTNDFSYMATNSTGQSYAARPQIVPATFTAGMVAFVKSIQKHYPKAYFFLLTSPMLSDTYPTTAAMQHTTQSNAILAAIKKIGAKAQLVDWPTQGLVTGCDYHPDAATQAQQGQVLASAIASTMGW